MNTEQATKKLLSFDQKIKQATEKANELSAELKLLEKELKKYKLKSLKEAETELKRLSEEIEEKEKIFIDSVEELENEFNKFQE